MHHTYMYQDQGQGSKTQIYASCVHVSGLRIMDKCIIHMCIVVMCIRIDTCIIHACIMIKYVFHLLIIHACIIIKDVLYPRGLKLPEIGKVTSDSQNRLVRPSVRSEQNLPHHTHMRYSQGSRITDASYINASCTYQDQEYMHHTKSKRNIDICIIHVCIRIKPHG